MFDSINMLGNHEQRAVARFEQDSLTIDTCAVTDSAQPYGTAVCHPAYNDSAWVIVELYDTKEQAQAGHDKWVKTMTADKLPDSLRDVSSAGTAKLRDMFATGDEWRTYSRDSA